MPGDPTERPLPEMLPADAPGVGRPVADEPVAAEVVVPLVLPVPARATRLPLLHLAIYALAAGNVLVLWMVRGPFVDGWDLLGASFGALTFSQNGFVEGMRVIAGTLLGQRTRPVFTGGESLIYGAIPGLLNTYLAPWLLWSHLLNLVLFVLISIWIVRSLGLKPHLYWACVAASPALTSLSIVGLPDLPSTAIPFSLAIGWVLSRRQEHRHALGGALLDLLVFAGITVIAFNGYESGKSFFVVPVIAAVTVGRIPLLRRVTWLGCATFAAWLVHSQAPGTMVAALDAIPHDPVAFSRGVLSALRAYFLDTYIDFPALAIAALATLPLLRERRLFWTILYAAAAGLVSLNVFYLDGAFLVPHRFLLLGFVAALIVSVGLSQSLPRGAVVAVGGLVAAGIAFNTYTTTVFARHPPGEASSNWNADRTYPLPYNRAKLDAHIWRDRLRDARTIVALAKRGTEGHVFFYGFSVGGEDTVNPQVLPARILLPLGLPDFTARVRFFDHKPYMYLEFPIAPLSAVGDQLARVPTPFYVYVREPEYSADSLIAKYFNGSQIHPVDLGLSTLKAFRVDQYRPAGPIPVRPLPAAGASAGDQPGFCLTAWEQDNPGDSPLRHWYLPLAEHLRALPVEPRSNRVPDLYRNVQYRVVASATAQATSSSTAYFQGWVENTQGGPATANLLVRADDEIAVVVNGQTIIESQFWKPPAVYFERMLLPPGRSEITIVYHKFWQPGGVDVTLTDAADRNIPVRCAIASDPHATRALEAE
jgi:hypothetical protein